ncbi:hypothetical protein [Ligilactobacillus acidipiscis]|uniref:hypothetical protein n=1 Tax=Ligilactobacillus acidipiscis TaxID=89059 RepID=UPI0023F8FD69|nr:hypothetical protein [Ligilactobacillus acidipiscis]WEV56415.1 hypothetical protein OZX66_09305 [Ligilactobacillus acidipiscis]
MVKIKVSDDNYSDEVNNAKAAADSLTTKNGVKEPSEKLRTKTIKNAWEEYDQLTNAINKYAELVIYDVSRFKQAGKNQVSLDASLGNKKGED